MKFTINIFFIISLLGACSIHGTAQTYGDEYNLGLKVIDGSLGKWHETYGCSFIRMSNEIHGRDTLLKVSQGVRWGTRQKFHCSICGAKPILLPAPEDSKWIVNISYRCTNMNIARLYSYSLNSEMELIQVDSICMENCCTVKNGTMAVDAQGVKFILLRVLATGVDSTYASDSGIELVEKSIPEELWLGDIRIKNGPRQINDSDFHEICPLAIDRGICMDLAEDHLLSFTQLSRIMSRITAFGETVHGSIKIGKAACTLIRSGVMNNNVKLIIFEEPILKMLFYNSFVQGNDSLTYDALKRLFNSSISETESFLELADWLKNYNRTAKEKVLVMGNEMLFENEEMALYLKDYLKTIKGSKYSPILDSLISACTKLYVHEQPGAEHTIRRRAQSILKIIEENNEPLRHVLREDLPVMQFYFKSLLNTEFAENVYFARDARNYLCTRFLIDRFCGDAQNVVISCHIDHALYTSSIYPFNKPFGHYMRKQYGIAYKCIAQTVCQDEVKSYSHRKPDYMQLPLPPDENLETSMARIGLKLFYVDSKALNVLTKVRIKGSTPLLMDVYVNPRSQFSGVLHVN